MTATIKIQALNSKLTLSERKCTFKGTFLVLLKVLTNNNTKLLLFSFYSAGIQSSKMPNISKKIDVTTDEQRNVKGRIQNF